MVPMHEPLWQPLVKEALCRSMSLRSEGFHQEVPTREGSIADLVYVWAGRITIFEMKKGDDGQALTSLSGRSIRQLRHYRRAADAVYLVTVCGPRKYNLGHDGNVVNLEPLEMQALPEKVGWIAFDRYSLDCAILTPAQIQNPDAEDRQFVVDHLLGRLGRATRAIKEARVSI